MLLKIFCTRHGSFYGSDSHAEHHSDDHLKGLPSHEYEIDMNKQELLNDEDKASKISVQSEVQSSVSTG